MVKGVVILDDWTGQNVVSQNLVGLIKHVTDWPANVSESDKKT